MCENVAFKNLESLLIILLSLKHYLVSFSRIHKQELFPTIIINLFYNFFGLQVGRSGDGHFSSSSFHAFVGVVLLSIFGM